MSSAVYNRCGRSVGVYKIINENTTNVNEVLVLAYVRNDDFPKSVIIQVDYINRKRNE